MNETKYDYECKCTFPYYGKSCEQKIDICQNVTCSNTGSCNSVGINETLCKCYKGYYGDGCELVSWELKVAKAVGET